MGLILLLMKKYFFLSNKQTNYAFFSKKHTLILNFYSEPMSINPFFGTCINSTNTLQKKITCIQLMI